METDELGQDMLCHTFLFCTNVNDSGLLCVVCYVPGIPHASIPLCIEAFQWKER